MHMLGFIQTGHEPAVVLAAQRADLIFTHAAMERP